MDTSGLVVLVAIAVAAGVIGTVVPFGPGLGLVVVATLVYGVVHGFGAVGVVAFAVIVALAIGGTIAGVVVPKRAAGTAGAPRSSMVIGAIGAVVGFFVVPIVGMPVGGAFGVYLAERVRTGDGAAAWRTTQATLKGFGLAGLVQFAAGLAMALTWTVWVIAD